MNLFDLRANRIGYSTDILVPPDGFHFERAVATTYSLDMETLLAVLIPLAFGKAMEPDAFGDVEQVHRSKQPANEGLLLQALEKTASRLTIFYQAGQIHMPRHDTALFPLLDSMLVPVMLGPIDKRAKNAAPCGDKDKEPIPSFHPKTWTIEYQNDDGESFCRFAVLSRNLTFDNCLDISFAIESNPDKPNTGETRRLCGFLSFLDERLPSSPAKSKHHERIDDLKEVLRKHPLGLGESSHPWTDFEILPFVPGRGPAKHPLLTDPLFSKDPLHEKLRDVVVISPFLGKPGNKDPVVTRIANRIQKPDEQSTVLMAWPEPSPTSPGNPAMPRRIPKGSALVTRPESFASLDENRRPSPDVLPAWALKDNAIPPIKDADEAVDEDADSAFRDSGLHAKVYLWRRTGETNLLLGSMNATDSGLCRNVEMMIRLRCDSRSYNGKMMLRDLFGNEEWWKEDSKKGEDSKKKRQVNPFEPISGENLPSSDEVKKQEEDRNRAQDAVRDFCGSEVVGRVEKNGEVFAIILSIPASFDSKGVECSIRPLRGGRSSAEIVPGWKLPFGELRLEDLSELFVFTAKTSSCAVKRIVQLHVEGIDAGKRDSAARAAVVSQTGGWRSHLEFLFSEDAIWTAYEQQNRNGGGGSQASSEGLPPGLYEQMLRAAGRDDKKSFQDAEALLEGQNDSDAVKVRELLKVFTDSLSTGRKGK